MNDWRKEPMGDWRQFWYPNNPFLAEAKRREMNTEDIRVTMTWDKKKDTLYMDFPDCPEPYRTLLKEASQELRHLRKKIQTSEEPRDG